MPPNERPPVDYWLTPEQLVRVYARMAAGESYEQAAAGVVRQDAEKRLGKK